MQVFLVIIESASPEELLRFPHMFWSIWAILYSDYEQEYLYAIKVIAAYVHKLDFNDDSVVKVFLSSAPNDRAAPFLGLQPMVLKGLASKVAEPESRRLLIQLVNLSASPLVEPHANPRRRYLSSLMGLLPWSLAEITESPDEVTAALTNLADRLEEVKLVQLAAALRGFMALDYASDDEFLDVVAASVAANFFPSEEMHCFTLLVEYFRLGPQSSQKHIVRILRALVRHVNWSASTLKEGGIPLFNCLISTPYWKEVLPLLSSLLQHLPVHVDITKADDMVVTERFCEFDKAPRTWTSEDRGKAIISNAIFAVVSPLEEAEGPKLPKPQAAPTFVLRKEAPGAEPVAVEVASPKGKRTPATPHKDQQKEKEKEKPKEKPTKKGKKKKGEKKKKDKKKDQAA